MKIFNLTERAITSKFYFIAIFLNLSVVIFLLALPYYLFEGRLFLGGDDTRLHYIYPLEFIKNLSFFSWVNISSLPTYLPNHHSIPFLLILAMLDNLINSKVILFYLAFSMPFILGFIYFQKFIRELTDRDFFISFAGSLIYIFSPITVISQMSNFLFSMYLVALFPLIAYYYIAFVKRGKISDIYKVIIWSIIFSIAFYGIQWILGLLFPLVLAFILLIFIDNPIKRIYKRTIIFCYFVFASQLFWLFPFVMSLMHQGESDLGGKVASEGFINSFVATVLSTGTGNIIYPLLTFYHRRIAFDYEWHVRHVFTNYFDYMLPFSIIFVLVLLLGFMKYNQVLNSSKKKVFIFFSASFILVLFFSTVNIGILKDLFLLLGNIPGFAIFRNFTDKFALAYIFIYASLLALSLLVIKKSYKFYSLILVGIILAVSINLVPVKQIIVTPLWKTDNIYTTVSLPQEYISFTGKAASIIPNDTNIIAFPQNITSYAIITEDSGKNTYVGTSPFKYFTGINDVTGSASYPDHIASQIQKNIISRDYKSLLTLLSKLNIGYVMVTNNIPEEVKASYIFDNKYLKFQDKQFIDSIIDHEVLHSDKKNYVIYKLRNLPKIINSDGKVKYHKISSVLYEVKIESLNKKQQISFTETYHPGWKLYLSKEKIWDRNAGLNDILFLTKQSIFDNTHNFVKPYGNEWIIDSEVIKKVANKSLYKENKDGSIDVVFYLFFYPQIFFYVGVMLSLVALILGMLALARKKNEDNKKNK